MAEKMVKQAYYAPIILGHGSFRFETSPSVCEDVDDESNPSNPGAGDESNLPDCQGPNDSDGD